MDEITCMVKAVRRITRFYAEESCGQELAPNREWQALERKPCQQWSVESRSHYPIGKTSFAAYLDTTRVLGRVKILISA